MGESVGCVNLPLASTDSVTDAIRANYSEREDHNKYLALLVPSDCSSLGSRFNFLTEVLLICNCTMTLHIQSSHYIIELSRRLCLDYIQFCLLPA